MFCLFTDPIINNRICILYCILFTDPLFSFFVSSQTILSVARFGLRLAFASFFIACTLHDFLFLKRTFTVLCRRELFSKSRRIIDFLTFCLVVEAAAKMRFILMPVKCYFHLFSDYFFSR